MRLLRSHAALLVSAVMGLAALGFAAAALFFAEGEAGFGLMLLAVASVAFITPVTEEVLDLCGLAPDPAR